VILWDVPGRKRLRKLETTPGYVHCLTFSPDGKTLATGSAKGIYLWDPATGKQLACLKGHKGDINCLAFSPDGKMLASGGDDKTIKLWVPAATK
jgi:WD40 repeat protein